MGLRVKELGFRYDRFTLGDISFEARYGEVLGILGPNASGKTTLVKCILNLLPYSGSVLVDGKGVSQMGVGALARIMAFVPQIHNPVFPYRVLDVVLMGRAPHLDLFSSPSHEDREIALSALRDLGVEKLWNRPYTRISGGETRLVMIAKALAQEPRILVLDEPTAHLDFKNELIVLEKVRSLAKDKEIAVIATLHNPNHAARYTDQVLLLKDGETIGYGRPSEMINKGNLMSAYGINAKIIKLKDRTLVVPEKPE